MNDFPPLLTPKEEASLISNLSNGSREARDLLIQGNLRLVLHIIKKFENTVVHPDDLFSIGTIGLIKAVDTFKPDKKVKLATYAARCIENEILMYLRSNKKSTGIQSLEDTLLIDNDGNELTVFDILGDNDSGKIRIDCAKSSVEHAIIKRFELEELLPLWLSKLSTRQHDIIRLRFFTIPKLTQKEVAKKLGISRSYTSRLERKAIKALRKQAQNSS